MSRFTPNQLTQFAAALALSLGLLTAAQAEDDLFSEVAVESVFASSKKKADSGSVAASSVSQAIRITGAGQLGELLRSAGFEPKRLGTKSVKVTVSHGPWTIPTTLKAAVSRGQVDVTMGLATPGKDSKLASAKLLELLKGDAGAAYFAFESETGQIQLRQSVSARGLTSDDLSRLLKEMAELAASRESSWYSEPQTASTTPTSGPAATPAAATLPAGTWLAKPSSTEAFALKIEAAGKFSLAYVKNGSTVTSTGTATRTGAQVKLAGSDGKSIAATISGQSAQGFTLTLTGGKTLTFAKAK